MKRGIFNITFAISFLVIFSIIIRLYFDDFAQALTEEPKYFPPHKALPIDKCQEWTNIVRDFGIEVEESVDNVTVLLYHRVIPEEELRDNHYDHNGELYSTILVKEDFEEQMALLKDHDYVTLTAKELQLFLKGELGIPKNSVVITFDDGFKDNYYEAYPVLKEHDFHAINFIITSFINVRDVDHDPTYSQYLSVSDVEKGCDVFEYQSHTYNFHERTFNFKAFLEVKPNDEIKEDLLSSINNLNDNKRAFAYPYGEYNDRTITILEEIGFEMAFTTAYTNAKVGDNLYEIPRKEVYANTSIEEFKVIMGLDEEQ
ncbi:polysaccharide deacetylase family protein [Evansella cellulosilytica]|uniref:Polysaccharide deacetylase n=1 Tax=Evansella cellulosilytica (strain ATCC 21833 / DSM 2522 / FERM P-1141 / JCM 9156 / N-4) TaxID=649639 RepID=E6TUD9_EVAC2|nr:polysaccharide deacetylase family protein [Evansella cellulosilytica]ADU29695.1 polysaccharide deacetylase [Evansella cellulosilytica DSM 2522]